MPIRFTLNGSIPSKKNSRICFVKGGKQFNIPSKNYKEWHNNASSELNYIKQTYNHLEFPIISGATIDMLFYSGDKRKWDLTNKAESIMDLLVDNGILDDDNYSVVRKIFLMHGGYDKGNARVEVTINI